MWLRHYRGKFRTYCVRACFLCLVRSKLRLCSANHRTGYFSNLACDCLSIVWAYSEQDTENGPRSSSPKHLISQPTHDVIIMSLLRQNYVVTRFWRNNDLSLRHMSIEMAFYWPTCDGNRTAAVIWLPVTVMRVAGSPDQCQLNSDAMPRWFSKDRAPLVHQDNAWIVTVGMILPLL